MHLGIDVSHHQNPHACDWIKLRDEGKVEFVIARACYGVQHDASFVPHARGAAVAGLVVGAYTFYRQTQSWQDQHAAFEAQLRRLGYGQGNLVPCVDLEWNDSYDGPVDREKFNGEARALCERLAADYGHCLVYFSPGFYEVLKRPAWLSEHAWWIAHYTREPEPWSLPGKEWALWQYSGSGQLAGYAGQLDLNRARSLPLVQAPRPAPLLPLDADWEEMQRERDAWIRDKDE